MNRFLKRAWAEIDLDALEHNYNEIKKLAKGKDILAVVKANAYGHDDKAVCLKLQELGVKYYGVSNLWEGEKLRQHGITGTILTFGYTDEDYFDELLEIIKEIRTSERRFYQKVTDIFAECEAAQRLCCKQGSKAPCAYQSEYRYDPCRN